VPQKVYQSKLSIAADFSMSSKGPVDGHTRPASPTIDGKANKMIAGRQYRQYD
jgi:hypothetical protein